MADGRMMRLENDSSLPVWNVSLLIRFGDDSPSHPVQTTSPESLGIPLLLTLIHEWLSPRFLLVSPRALQVRPPLISERRSLLGSFTLLSTFSTKYKVPDN